ncbi:DNA translocase FtsK [uncultured Treponema sp.]|uniref:DNA translocase FtsK n=1 Tax=uncultured Treponema sp. TaxID=162155 RepID=UPI0025E59876|nr:DNA translocase FtsK [uncultured Treponema sp.]
MTKKERIAATLTGIALYCVAALFSIGLFLGALDFGLSSGKNILFKMGEMLVSVYGICSILIPAFFFVAGSFCLSAKWSVQRAFILLISIVPFFTLVIAERTSQTIAAQDTSPIAFAKIFTLVAIAFLLVALEYLLAVTAATYLEKAVERKISIDIKKIKINPKKIKTIIKSKLNFPKQKISVQKEKIQEEKEEEKIPEEELDFEIPQKKVRGVWSIDSEGNVKGKVSAPEEKHDETVQEEIQIPENEDSAEKNEEDIIDLFEKKSMDLTEEISKAEQEELETSEQIDYDIDFEEPEDFLEEQDNEYFDIQDENEPEESEVSETETQADETELSEDDFEIKDETEDYSVENENHETENDFEIEDFDSEKNFKEPEETQEISFENADYKENIPAENFNAEINEENTSEPSNLESVFSKMEEDARIQVEKENITAQEKNSAPIAFTTTEDGNTKPIPLPPKKKNNGPYKISTDLLTAYDENKYWIIDEETEQAAKSLKDTLSEFKIDAEVTGIRKGPVVTMFELLPAPGVKLSRIVALSDNIALRLAASSVRIVAPIPGKRAVGIEVPNRNRAIVSFRECIEQQRNEWKKMAVPVVLGKDIQGETQIMDLVKTPHLLIAGSTGAGKSVCVNSMILSILYKRNPHEVKMILIDPKIVELKLYNGIPHLLTPVITEPKKAMQALQYCLCEMERRYAVLDSMGCRDIANYNRKIVEQHIATEKLPYLIVIIDEFADLMATTGKALEGVVARLAAMSRAVGIHLVLATQRPSVDVITGLIKANIPSRIAFMVAAKMDSRIIIDQVGAEKLLGKGDMLYASATDPFPVRIQGAFVSDQEVENVVEAVKAWGEPEYIDDEIFVDDEDDENADQLSLFGEGAEDPLYEKALDIVIQAGKASASYIQRRLSIGYNRAARLVEEMEERGIVGPANGSKPREIIHVP